MGSSTPAAGRRPLRDRGRQRSAALAAGDRGNWFGGRPGHCGRAVFVGAQDGLLLAVDAASGEERWRVELGPGSVANLPLPAVADGVVYAGGGEGILLAVDAASGQERWRLAVGGEAIGAPRSPAGSSSSRPRPTSAVGALSWSRWTLPTAPSAGGWRWGRLRGAGDGRRACLRPRPGRGRDGGAPRPRRRRAESSAGGTTPADSSSATRQRRRGASSSPRTMPWSGSTRRQARDVASRRRRVRSAPPPAIADGVVYVFAGRVDPIANTQSGVVLAVEAASGASAGATIPGSRRANWAPGT